MIFLILYCYSLQAQEIIDKTIYLIEGEEYKVNLDSIFKEESENIYSFKSNNKGFTLETSSLKLKSDQGTYQILPTKIIRERQLVNIGDNQGQGQFGILDQHDGNRICYNNDSTMNLDQCIELDDTATSYDFVFIDRNTIAVSMVRVVDQQFGVTIYQNKEKINEFYFVPSKTYTFVTKTIIEYCVFGTKKYLLVGVTDEGDSNIEFLEIQDDFQIVNTNKVIDKSQLPKQLNFSKLEVYDIKGKQDRVYVVCNQLDETKLIISFIFQTNWIQKDYFLSQNFRGFELGYSNIQQTVAETYLECQQDKYKISSNKDTSISNNLHKIIKLTAKVRYTLNYLIVLQDNMIFVTPLNKSAQRQNIINGSLLTIDVDFQNDILFVFTNQNILTYYLKQATLSYSSTTITKNLDQVIIQAFGEDDQQIANINFQVVSKQDYNIYLLKDLNQDLYYNQLFDTTKFSIPLNGISGSDIKVDGKVDNQVQIIPKYLLKYDLNTQTGFRQPIILEQLLTNRYGPYLFRQYEDFSFTIFECQFKTNTLTNTQPNTYYQCDSRFSNQFIYQEVSVQYSQIAKQYVEYAILQSDGLEINIYYGYYYQNKVIKPSSDSQFVDMKVGIDRLFVYTTDNLVQFYQFPSGELINQINLSQYGQQQGETITKLWVNQAKTNLLIITYGEDLIIGRFTTQFIFIQIITIQWVIDVQIIADNKFIVLSTDKNNKKLTQYTLEDGTVKIQREFDLHGYIITGDNIISDYVMEEIIIQAQKDQKKAVLVFGNTELTRDSLLKIINLEDEESLANVIYNENKLRLLIRTTNYSKNSSIIDLNYTHQEFQTYLAKIPSKISQQLDIKYVYESQFSLKKIELMKKFYLEYQFQYITVKQSQVNKTYQNDSLLRINIKSDTFNGQVNYYEPKNNKDHPEIKLTTRFQQNKHLFISLYLTFECKQVVSYERIMCTNGANLSYYYLNGEILSEISPKTYKTGSLKQFILRDDDQYALIRAEKKLILVNISQDKIQDSTIFFDWITLLDISIFHKGWLVIANETHLSYFKFQPQENDQWQLDIQYEYFISGIKAIQYDPITEQIFYSIGDSNLYYFKCSLEGDSIMKQDIYSLNLPQLLLSLKIYQIDTKIINIQIINQQMKSYIFVSTSYGIIWNITVKSYKEDFKVNNMYIINGPVPYVKDIQLVDDYVLVQNQDKQILYKKNPKISLDIPNLPLEGIVGFKFMWLYKNGSQIIHIYNNYPDSPPPSNRFDFYQNNIDDQVYLTIDNLTVYQQNKKYITIYAKNGYGNQAYVNYTFVQQEDDDDDNDNSFFFYLFKYKWIALILIISILIIARVFYYFYTNRRQQVEPEPRHQNLLQIQENLEVE